MSKLDKIVSWCGKMEQSMLSIVKVALLSRKPSPLPRDFRNHNELIILANGTSLNDTVAENRQFIENKTLMAVNFSVLSPMFRELKPELYLIADPLFWIVPEKRDSLFVALAKNTDWDLHLFIPVRASGNKEWQKIVSTNPQIHIHLYNTTPVEGFNALSNFLYRKGLGVPRPHNVLIPSIAIGLRLPFRKIYLAGADHSWLPEISVTEDNQVLMHQKHFYDNTSSKADTVKQEDLNPARLHTILYHMHVAFKAYFTLLDYARTLGKEIINITPGSFIDAFPRLRVR